MNTTKVYAAKSSVTRAIKAAGLDVADYTVDAVEGGFVGNLIVKEVSKVDKFIAAAKTLNFADTKTLAASVEPLPIDGGKKPRNGNVAKVWAIADSMPNRPRKEVVEACIAAGVNPGTARTQFQSWSVAKRG